MQLARQQSATTADFGRLLDQVHEVGRGVVTAAAGSVDRDARFPAEGISALKDLKLLSAYIPVELGGMGLNVVQIAKICEILGQYDGSVAMIYAMHKIQVACMVHHGLGSNYVRSYLQRLVQQQRLIASATTEVGTGGDLRSSICAIDIQGDRFSVTKKAPVISYGAYADDIVLTCRRTADSPASDQLMVLTHKDACQLEPISGWDTLGFRGTCSAGFVLTAGGSAEQVMPTPFSEILSRTMHPYSHIVWGSLWLGIATDAVNHARGFVRAEARRNPSIPPTSSLRLAEVDIVLQGMRNNIAAAVSDYHRLLSDDTPDASSGFGFAIRINNLKLASSTLIVDIVSRAMLICGISGYRNDSKFSLCRHLRDAYGAALMVNNDRIMNHNATMLLTQREG
jgi:acyl-CoA dehydrogenase